MNKYEQIKADMTSALREGNKLKRLVLSDMVSTIDKVSTSGKTRVEITDAFVNETLIKYKKTIQEMVDTCPADRVETLEEYKAQMTIISEFAPVLLTDEATILEMITGALAENSIEPLKKNKGAVMKTVMPMFKGKADMSVVNKVIGELLQ